MFNLINVNNVIGFVASLNVFLQFIFTLMQPNHVIEIQCNDSESLTCRTLCKRDRCDCAKGAYTCVAKTLRLCIVDTSWFTMSLET